MAIARPSLSCSFSAALSDNNYAKEVAPLTLLLPTVVISVVCQGLLLLIIIVLPLAVNFTHIGARTLGLHSRMLTKLEGCKRKGIKEGTNPY